MKIMIFILGMFFICSSCTTSDEIFNETSQKWQLVRMTGSFVNSETTGEAMDWQEYFIFKTDGTFIKSRIFEGTEKEAFGTYQKIESEDYSYLELQYISGNELKASCSQTESLIIRGANILTGNWSICDGPRLEYKQMKK
tara:strand:+ start:5997 stop:6416 length:420 start_codon:yes stop_codon:yes gene_type:complete